jgi:hypothetical protein
MEGRIITGLLKALRAARNEAIGYSPEAVEAIELISAHIAQEFGFEWVAKQ